MGIRRASDNTPEPVRRALESLNNPSATTEPAGSSLFAEEPERKPRRKKVEDMTHDEAVEAAKNSALNTLSMVAKTRSELTDKLTGKGFPDDVIAEALDRLGEVGLVDDTAFARSYVSSRHDARGLAGSAIKRELARKGIDAETIDAALEDIDRDAETARARALVEKKAPSTRNLPRDTRVRRLVGMLARKGYSPSIAFPVIKEILDAEGADTDDLVAD